MKLKTKQPVTIQQWKDQAERFAKVSDKGFNPIFPKSDANEMPAIIKMQIVEPLTQGFKGRVVYTQQFEEIIESTNETGETIQTPILKQHKVVDYYEIMAREEADALFAFYEPNVPSDITSYLDKQDWIIKQAFIGQVVQRNTFGGLGVNDYEFVKE
mgnify:FL=1